MPPDLNRHTIRTSERLLWKKCRRQWDFVAESRQNLEPKNPNKALSFGTCVHAGLAEYYSPPGWNRPIIAKQGASLATFLSELKKHYDSEVALEYSELKELGIGMLQNYFTWAPERDNFTPIMCEIEFEVPISSLVSNSQMLCPCHGWPVFYQGRWDLLVRDEDGLYWLIDHKTTAQLTDTEFLELDEQVKSYCWAGQIQLEIDIAGALFNELKKAAPHPPQLLKNGTLSKNKQQNTTFGLYLAEIHRLGQNERFYSDFLEFLSGQPNKYFRRTPCNYSQLELRNQGNQIYFEAFDMLNEPSIYPNPNKMGCRMCSFRTPCLATNDGSDLGWIINDSYQTRKESRVIDPAFDDDMILP